jgi:protein TonB
MVIRAASPGTTFKQHGFRLLVACSLSLLLHLAVLLGVAVHSTGGAPNAAVTIHAWLEPAANREPQLEPQETALTSTEKTRAAKNANGRAEASATTVEPKPESRQVAPELLAPSDGDNALRLTPDQTYYPAKQLDVYPQPLTPIKLNFPDTAATHRGDGRVLLLLLIDEFGAVNEVSVVEAQPEGLFEDAALSVLRATQFLPAQKQGRPVKSRVLLQVNYIQGDSAGTAR